MKRVLILVMCLVGLWTSIALAASENWEYVGDNKDSKLYVDTTSISYRPTTRSDIYKVNAKSERTGNRVNFFTILVNSDTKEYSYITIDAYENNVKYAGWAFHRDDWISKDYEGLGLIVDKTIESGNKLRVLN